MVSKAVVRDATTRIPQKAARRRRDESRANIGGNCLERDEGPGVASKLGDDGIATSPKGSRVCCSWLTGSISRAGEIEATFSWAFSHLAATFFSINASLNTMSIAISPNALQEMLVRHARTITQKKFQNSHIEHSEIATPRIHNPAQQRANQDTNTVRQ